MKMTKIGAIILSAVMMGSMSAIPSFAQEESQNLIVNGDFENGREGWNGSESAFTVEEDENGNHYAKTSASAAWNQQFEIKRDKWYHFSAKYKLQDSSQDGEKFARPALVWLPNVNDTKQAETWFITSKDVTTDQEWVTVDGYFTFGGRKHGDESFYPGTDYKDEQVYTTDVVYDTITVRLQLRFGYSNNTPICIDDVSFTEVGNIVEPGFENNEIQNIKPGEAANKTKAMYNTKLESPWQRFDSGKVSITAEAAHSGKYGVKVSPNTSADSYARSKVIINPEKRYEISAWMKVNNASELTLNDGEWIQGKLVLNNIETTLNKALVAEKDAAAVESYNTDSSRKEDEIAYDMMNSSVNYCIPSGADLTDGEWHLVKGIFDPAKSKVKINNTDVSLSELGASALYADIMPRVQIQTGTWNASSTPVEYFYDDITFRELGTSNIETTAKLKDDNTSVAVKIVNNTADSYIGNFETIIAQYKTDESGSDILVGCSFKAWDQLYPTENNNTPGDVRNIGIAYDEIPIENKGADKIKVFTWKWDEKNPMQALNNVINLK